MASRSKNVTLTDVAREAGVGVSTASYVVNNDPRIKEETRNKVLEAVKKLGYVPQGMARDMRKNKTKIVGLFLRDISGPFYNMLMWGINQVAQEYGYELIICVSSGKNSKDSYRFLRERRIDGAIILEPYIKDELLLHVSHSTFPIVVLDRELNSEHIISVVIDNFQGEYDACEHLIKTGRRKIAYIEGAANSYDSNKRKDGFIKCLKDYSINLLPNHIVSGDFVEEGGFNAMQHILASGDIPDGIIAANDQMAMGAIRAIKEASLSVPDDIAVVGFDNIQISSLMTPSLTTIDYHEKEWGHISMQYLMYALEHGSFGETCKSMKLPVHLIKRESTSIK
jgi:LacI family transcriptional regulator